MRLLHNWFRPKDQIKPVSFLHKLAIANFNPNFQSILVSIFRICLLRLSAGTYKATSLTAANVVSHLEQF